MRVFVTGASGFIGQALIKELLCHNHQVLGLARNATSASTITKLGAESLTGDLEDPESLRRGASSTDATIHLAHLNDFTDIQRTLSVDRAAIQALGSTLAGTEKPLVIASGTMMCPKEGVLATEDTPAEKGTLFGERGKSEDLVFALAGESGFKGQVVRLPPTVHGAGDKGFIAMLVDGAKKSGVATYVGDGEARWPAVHRRDAAKVFRLAAEKGEKGKMWHAVAEQGVRMKEIVGAIGKRLGVEVKSMGIEEAVEKIGFVAAILAADNPTSSEKTRTELGWEAKEDGLLADMEKCYF
ncbi:MAG: hypothetical protein Q9227_006841 [Pyrenula ochraceoflavens]